jgi:hypothetical protein
MHHYFRAAVLTVPLIGGLRVLVMALALLSLPSAHADESLPDYTVASMMERLIPRNQLLSYGPGDLPTFYRWYVPIKLMVVSRDDGARAAVEREIVAPLLEQFHEATNIDATLAEHQSKPNVILIIGESPQQDLQFYAEKIREVSRDPAAYSDLVEDAQPGTPPCYRNWRFVEGSVETAALYAPLPSKDAALSRKCVAVNLGVLFGLLGKPSGGDTITNIRNESVHFTKGDMAALRVLYDERIDTRKKLSMAEIESLLGSILPR